MFLTCPGYSTQKKRRVPSGRGSRVMGGVVAEGAEEEEEEGAGDGRSGVVVGGVGSAGGDVAAVMSAARGDVDGSIPWMNDSSAAEFGFGIEGGAGDDDVDEPASLDVALRSFDLFAMIQVSFCSFAIST